MRQGLANVVAVLLTFAITWFAVKQLAPKSRVASKPAPHANTAAKLGRVDTSAVAAADEGEHLRMFVPSVERSVKAPGVSTVIREDGKTMSTVVALLTNNRHPFPSRALATISELRTVGEYKGDIVMVFAPDMRDQKGQLAMFAKHNVKFAWVDELLTNLDVPTHCKNGHFNNWMKRKQGWKGYYYKLSIFNHTYWSKWDRLFYIDGGIHVHHSIAPFWEIPDSDGAFMAHSDSWPHFTLTLKSQFWRECNEAMWQRLNNSYDMKLDYFQTTIMLIDTAVLEGALPKLIELYHAFGEVADSDQAIMNLHFGVGGVDVWRSMPNNQANVGFLYDYTPRILVSAMPKSYSYYIMTKHYCMFGTRCVIPPGAKTFT